jgi:hypothetical protein
MIYALIFLYIVPAIHFYWEASEEPELIEGLRWTIPVFLWPVMLPYYMISVMLFGRYEDRED